MNSRSTSSHMRLYTRHLRPPLTLTLHLWRLGMMTGFFVIISTIALVYSLGYHINWATYRFEETGVIALDTPRRKFAAQIHLDNKVVGTQIPDRLSYLSPGRYELSVDRAGYQSWHRTVLVQPNAVSTFRNIMLIRQNPRIIQARPEWLPVVVPITDPGLEIRGSEIWNNGAYVTRVSGTLYAAHWFPSGQYIAYQTDGDVYLLELDGLTTQKLLSLNVQKPIPFVFRNGGQVMVYQDGTIVKAQELYNTASVQLEGSD